MSWKRGKAVREDEKVDILWEDTEGKGLVDEEREDAV
jgi:hypothetical protein